jgi:hypothetical protein
MVRNDELERATTVLAAIVECELDFFRRSGDPLARMLPSRADP